MDTFEFQDKMQHLEVEYLVAQDTLMDKQRDLQALKVEMGRELSGLLQKYGSPSNVPIEVLEKFNNKWDASFNKADESIMLADANTIMAIGKIKAVRKQFIEQPEY